MNRSLYILLPSLALALFLLLFWQGKRNALVVYCAHDSIYAESILRDFTQRTGIPVAVRYDTEATKSLGLVEQILREKEHPQCDVFWNNEPIGTMDLQEKGLLLPYQGSGFTRIPAKFKDPGGHWVGFGARMRVYILNTSKSAALQGATETALNDYIQKTLAGDLSRVALAKPIFGTTLTQYSVLWQLEGSENVKAWHRDWRQRHANEVGGNAAVKDLVSSGICDLGLTDTDDFFEAKDEGKPVTMLPIRLTNGSVLCIPNTVSILQGTQKLSQAKILVDDLLSEESELAMANSKSRQIPLGPVDETRLNPEVKTLQQLVVIATPLTALTVARSQCLAWLKSEK